MLESKTCPANDESVSEHWKIRALFSTCGMSASRQNAVQRETAGKIIASNPTGWSCRYNVKETSLGLQSNDGKTGNK